MIAPGLQLMAQSLALNTAQLPQVNDPNQMTAQFAQHTEAAILSGCLAAQAGAIEYAVRHFAQLSGGLHTSAEAPLCILSGGAAQFVQPSLRIAHKLVDNLVLIGLQAYSHTLC
jgi:type III pantothenate kinase